MIFQKKEVRSKELLMQDKMTVGNKWQQYVSAKMQEGACDKYLWGLSKYAGTSIAT